jgi:hypothetical protein
MNAKNLFKRKTSLKLLFGACFFAMGFGVFSCVDEEYDFSKTKNDMQFDPKLAMTLGTATIKLDSLLNKYLKSSGNVKDSSDGTMAIIFEKELKSFSGEQKISIPADQTVVPIPAFDFPAQIGASGQEFSEKIVPVPIKFLDDQIIDSLLVKTFEISVSGNSSYPMAQELTISFTNMKKGGNSYSETVPFQANEQNKKYVTANKTNGADYMLKFASTGTGSSSIPVTVRLTLKGNAGTVIPKTSLLTVNFLITELKYKVMYGYIGQPELMGSDETFDISFFDNEMSKNIIWKDPNITLSIKNSFAVPVAIDIQNMKTISNGTAFDAQPEPPAVFPKIINSPTAAYSWADDAIVMSNTSGFKKLFNNIQELAPQSVSLHLSAKPNPGGKIAGKNNILLDTSTLKTNLLFKLPIWFRSSGFGQTDTMDVNFFSNDDNSNQTVEFESLDFRIASQSDMPFDIKLDIKLCDENYKTLNTVNAYIVKAGQIDNTTGKVIKGADTTAIIRFNKDQLVSFQKTKKLIYNVTMSTADFEKYPNDKDKQIYIRLTKVNQLKLTFAFQVHPKITIKEQKK